MSETSERQSAAVSVLPVMLVACALVGVALFYLARRPDEVRLGTLADYPPSAEPYRVAIDSHFAAFLVNTGTEVVLLKANYQTGQLGSNCRVVWVPTNGRFEDPCSGAKFSLMGEWLEAAIQPPAIEHRGLERYTVAVRNNEIWLVQVPPSPGTLVATATP